MSGIIRIVKLLISGILLLVWMVITAVMLCLAVLSVVGIVVLVGLPELFLLWCVPAFFLLVFGGWISKETATEIMNGLTKENKDRGDDFLG